VHDTNGSLTSSRITSRPKHHIAVLTVEYTHVHYVYHSCQITYVAGPTHAKQRTSGVWSAADIYAPSYVIAKNSAPTLSANMQ